MSGIDQKLSEGYAEITTVWDGAVESEDIVGLDVVEGIVSNIAHNLKDNTPETGWEIYVLRHYHPLTQDECSCVQYETNHKPYRSLTV